MTRDNQVWFYTDDQTLAEIDARADQEDMSRSAWIHRAVSHELMREEEEALAAQTRAVSRLERVIEDGKRDLRDIATHIEDLNAKSGAYAVAAFELVAHDHPDPAVKNALQTAARRLSNDEDPLDVAGQIDDHPDEPQKSATADGDDGDESLWKTR